MISKQLRAMRRRFWRSLSFVTYVDERSRCDGVRWSRVPLKAVWHPRTHELQPASMLDPYRCRVAAHWRFEALAESRSTSGLYCMSHLFVQLHDPEEKARVDRCWEQFKRGQL